MMSNAHLQLLGILFGVLCENIPSLVGGLEHVFFIFPYVVKYNPNIWKHKTCSKPPTGSLEFPCSGFPPVTSILMYAARH